MEFKILEIKELLFESQESIEYTSGKDCKFGFDIDFSFDKQKEKNLF